VALELHPRERKSSATRRSGGLPVGLVATTPRGPWAALAPRGDGAIIGQAAQAPGVLA